MASFVCLFGGFLSKGCVFDKMLGMEVLNATVSQAIDVSEFLGCDFGKVLHFAARRYLLWSS